MAATSAHVSHRVENAVDAEADGVVGATGVAGFAVVTGAVGLVGEAEVVESIKAAGVVRVL